ncbi:MAG: hypothetical protein JWM98_165 [Thermoleophilia bacterium]|nr:hypothetical protein [Thermoleophilia bacterium]
MPSPSARLRSLVSACFLTVVALALFASVADAAAPTRRSAAAVALRAANVSHLRGPVVVFAESPLVRRGARVTASSTPMSLRAVEADRARARTIFTAIHDASVPALLVAREPSWFFYVDLAPDTQHAHPARVVLVGAISGRVQVSPILSSAPLVDGVAPSFLRSTAAYADPATRVFERLRTATAAPKLRPAEPTSGPTAAEFARQLGEQRSCVVLYGETFGSNGAVAGVDRSVRAVAAFYTRLAAADRRIVVMRFQAASRLSPTAFLAKVMRDHGCRNVVVYAAGAAQSTGDPAVLLGSAAHGRSVRLQELAARRIRDIVEAYPGTRFSIVVDAPHASRFRALMGDLPNLAAFLAPDGGDQSFAYVPRLRVGRTVVRNAANPGQLLEFTNDLLRGLTAFATSPDEVRAAGEQATLSEAAGGSSTATQSLGRGARLADSFTGHSAGVEPPLLEEDVPTTTPDANHAPVATAATVTLVEDGSATVTLGGTDSDGDAVTATIVSSPAHGALVGAGSLRTYTPLADYAGTDSISFTVTDSHGATSAASTIAITVTPINDAPVLDTAPATLAYAEGDGAQAVAPATTVSDIDSALLLGATVTIGSGYVAGEDVLGVANQGGISGAFDAPSGRLTLTGAASSATYQAALRAVTYTDTSSNPSTATRAVTTTVSDEALTTSDAASIVVTSDQDAPEVTTSAGSVAYTEQAASVQVDGGITLADVDDATLEGAVVRVATGFGAGDALTFTSANGITGSYAAGTGVLTLTGTSNVANYQTALRSVRFASTSDAPPASKAVGFVANDGDSNSVEATKAVAVSAVDDVPVAVADSATVLEDAVATAIDVLANDTDVDGGPKVVTSVTQPAAGAVVIAGGGAGVTFQPNTNVCGAQSFTYTLAPGGSTVTVSVTVTCVDDAPVAVADSTTVLEDAAATAVDVLANDTDVDLGSRSIASVTQPTHGTAVITGGGTGLTFQPEADSCGSDSFTYTLAPGTSTATVTANVTCVDDAPVAVADAPTVAEDSGATALDVLANDSDVDAGPKSIVSISQPADGAVLITGGGTGLAYTPHADFCTATSDTFTYTLTPGGSATTVSVSVTCVDDAPVALGDSPTVVEDSGANAVNVLANDTDIDGGPKTLASVTQPANGTVVITGGGTGLTYAPSANYCNTPPGTTPDTFTYTLTPGGSTTTVAVGVTCVDDAPVAVADSATVGEDSGATAIAVLANDTDVDAGPRSIASVTQPASGAVAITGGGTGLTFQPNANACGAQSFTYTLTPGFTTATVSATVTCVNDAPTAVALATSTVTENQVAPTVVGALSTSDVDAGDTFTYTVVGGADAASFDVSGANLRLLASADFETKASYAVTVRSTDATGAFAQQAFTVTVVNANDAPTDIALSNATVHFNEPSGTVVGTFSTTDQDAGDTPTFSLVTGAGDTDNASFQVVGTSLQTTGPLPGGSRSVRVQVTDVTGASYTEAFTITVVVNQTPTDVALSAATIVENAVSNTTVGALSTTDADAGDTFTYTLVAGAGSTDNASFNVSGATLRTSSALDFEAGATRTVRVRSTDSAGDFFEKAFTITVTDLNEAPSAVALASPDIDENAGANAVVGTVSTTDPDAGNTFTYALVAGTGSTDNAAFNVSGTNLRANASFNFEVKATYSVRVRSTDQGSLFTEQDFTITVNDVNEAPVVGADAINGANSAVGNTTLIVDDPSDGALAVSTPSKTVTGDVLANDTDPDAGQTATLTITAMTATAGTITTFQADGDFVYQPPAGCAVASDTVTYTVSDGTLTTIGTITIAISGCVFYVDNAAAGNAGTSTAPFDTLAQAEAKTVPGSTTYLSTGDGTSTGQASGYALDANEQLIGRAADLVVGGFTLQAATPSYPLITRTGADAVTLASGNTVSGFEVDPAGAGSGVAGDAGDASGTIAKVRIVDTGTASTQPGLDLVGTTGTWNVSDLTVDNTGATGRTSGSIGVNVQSAGTVNFLAVGTISINVAQAAGLVVNSSSLGSSTFDDITVASSTTGGVALTNTSGTTTLGDGVGTDLSLSTSSGASAALSLQNPGTVSVPAAGISNVSATGGPALDIVSATSSIFPLDQVTSTSSSTDGINFDGNGTSTLSASAGSSISGAAGIAVDINGGSAAFTFPGTLGDGAGATAEISGRTGGVIALTGNITDSSDAGGGISGFNNTGGSTVFGGAAKTLNTGASPAISYVGGATAHTWAFSGGGLDIDTTSGTGYSASGAGTVQVSGSGNSITSTTGTALDVANTTIGASGLTFQSISTNGSAKGIVLDTTGASGGLTVTGNGAAGSGGTIQNVSSRGVEARSVGGGLSLTRMNLTNANTVDAGGAGTCDDLVIVSCNGAIYLSNVSGVVLDRLTLTGAAEQGIVGISVSGFTLSNSTVANAGNEANESGVEMQNLSGIVNVTNDTISFPATNAFDVVNNGGTMAMTVSGSTFRDTQTLSGGGTSSIGEGGLQVRTFLAGNTTIDVVSSSFLRLRTQGIQVIGEDTSITSTDITGTTIDSGADIGTGIDLNSNDTAIHRYNIIGNPIIHSQGGSGVNITSFLGSTIMGRIQNNPAISVAAIGGAIRVLAQETSSNVVDITNNVATAAPSDAFVIDGISRAGTARLDATIANNTTTASATTGLADINFQAGASAAGESNVICGYVHNNAASSAGVSKAFRVRVSDISNTVRMYLQGFVASSEGTWNANGNTPVSSSLSEVAQSYTGTAVLPSAPPGGTCFTPSNPLP